MTYLPLTNVMAGLHLLAGPETRSLTHRSRRIALLRGAHEAPDRGSLISRMEGDRMPIRLTDVQPCQLADGALNQVSLWHGTPASPSRDYPPDAGGARRPRLMRRVPSSGNAIRHSPPQTVITLRIANVGDAVASPSRSGPRSRGVLSRIFDVTQVAARTGRRRRHWLGLTFCRRRRGSGRADRTESRRRGHTVITLPAARRSRQIRWRARWQPRALAPRRSRMPRRRLRMKGTRTGSRVTGAELPVPRCFPAKPLRGSPSQPTATLRHSGGALNPARQGFAHKQRGD